MAPHMPSCPPPPPPRPQSTTPRVASFPAESTASPFRPSHLTRPPHLIPPSCSLLSLPHPTSSPHPSPHLPSFCHGTSPSPRSLTLSSLHSGLSLCPSFACSHSSFLVVASVVCGPRLPSIGCLRPDRRVCCRSTRFRLVSLLFSFALSLLFSSSSLVFRFSPPRALSSLSRASHAAHHSSLTSAHAHMFRCLSIQLSLSLSRTHTLFLSFSHAPHSFCFFCTDSLPPPSSPPLLAFFVPLISLPSRLKTFSVPAFSPKLVCSHGAVACEHRLTIQQHAFPHFQTLQAIDVF